MKRGRRGERCMIIWGRQYSTESMIFGKPSLRKGCGTRMTGGDSKQEAARIELAIRFKPQNVTALHCFSFLHAKWLRGRDIPIFAILVGGNGIRARHEK